MKFSIDEHGNPVFGDVFNPIVIDTPDGSFGICQRDGGLEVVVNGQTVFSSNAQPEFEPEMVWVPIKEPVRPVYENEHKVWFGDPCHRKFQRLVTRQEADSKEQVEEAAEGGDEAEDADWEEK